MANLMEARKRRTMAPILAGISIIGMGVYYASRSKQTKESLANINVQGANGVIGAGGASTGKVSASLQETFGTGGSTAGTGTDYETKDTRVISNMTGIYTKREHDKPEDRDHRNPRVPRGENKKRDEILGVSGSPEK
ncbi:hypothetical protein NW762_013621 [Fusarium torreyae]|uniref:Uncharacterized protein n=1 Tax=Fusarium torreyae TaxID=1237075 RepID=A0A9W8RLU0_9HYPO|nr:hypothetical protein NW762_013621 [Fusarium torreyae]